MSKILELLNYHKKKEDERKEKSEGSSNLSFPENFDSSVKEKLANTYIFNPAKASEHVIKKQAKEVSRKQNASESKARFIRVFPWLITFLAVLLLLVNIAYRGRINIMVQVLGENANRAAPIFPEKNLPLAKDSVPDIKNIDAVPISTSLISEGYINSFIIKRLGFYGAAISRSRILQDGLYLFNDGTTGWASAGIDFPRPMDFSNATLDFFIKGERGRESFKLTLRDSNNNSYMPQASNIIFDKNMGTGWKFVSVPFTTFNGVYNPKKINHIGFEFGTQTTSNEPGASVHIKKIKIVKNSATP